jgi:hypothetical protein
MVNVSYCYVWFKEVKSGDRVNNFDRRNTTFYSNYLHIIDSH